MNGETLLQVVGYFSTILILISFLMTSVLKLRLVNLIGSAIFVVVAFLTRSYPTAIMNVGLCTINIYFIAVRGSGFRVQSSASVGAVIGLPRSRDGKSVPCDL